MIRRTRMLTSASSPSASRKASVNAFGASGLVVLVVVRPPLNTESRWLSAISAADRRASAFVTMLETASDSSSSRSSTRLNSPLAENARCVSLARAGRPAAKSAKPRATRSPNILSMRGRFLRVSRMPSKYSVWLALLSAFSARSNSVSSTLSSSSATRLPVSFNVISRTATSKLPTCSWPVSGTREPMPTTLLSGSACGSSEGMGVIEKPDREWWNRAAKYARAQSPDREAAHRAVVSRAGARGLRREIVELQGADAFLGQHHGDVVLDPVHHLAVGRDEPGVQRRGHLLAGHGVHRATRDGDVQGVQFVAPQRAHRGLGDRVAEDVQQSLVHAAYNTRFATVRPC